MPGWSLQRLVKFSNFFYLFHFNLAWHTTTYGMSWSLHSLHWPWALDVSLLGAAPPNPCFCTNVNPISTTSIIDCRSQSVEAHASVQKPMPVCGSPCQCAEAHTSVWKPTQKCTNLGCQSKFSWINKTMGAYMTCAEVHKFTDIFSFVVFLGFFVSYFFCVLLCIFILFHVFCVFCVSFMFVSFFLSCWIQSLIFVSYYLMLRHQFLSCAFYLQSVFLVEKPTSILSSQLPFWAVRHCNLNLASFSS